MQKTYKRTVVYILHLDGKTDVRKAGIRGNDDPLSWQTDLAITAVKKDTVYAATVTYFTGYKFTEIKFVVNDEFELKDGPNRRILFSDKDTTTCEAKFNINK